MAESHTIIVTHQRPGDEVKGSKQYSGDAAVTVTDLAVPDSTTDMLVTISIDVSQIVAVMLLSTVDMTVKTNSSSVPDETLSLKANVPYIWNTDSLDTNKLATDITKLYLTTGSVGAGVFNLVALIDPMP